jgi:hypothetical protein
MNPEIKRQASPRTTPGLSSRNPDSSVPELTTFNPRKHHRSRERSITNHLIQNQLEIQRLKKRFLPLKQNLRAWVAPSPRDQRHSENAMETMKLGRRQPPGQGSGDAGVRAPSGLVSKPRGLRGTSRVTLTRGASLKSIDDFATSTLESRNHTQVDWSHNGRALGHPNQFTASSDTRMRTPFQSNGSSRVSG